MEGLFCTSCRVTLDSSEESKDHYKSDFHTYNIKRKLVNLAPVSFESYQIKQRENSLLAQGNSEQRCHCCGRNFNSLKAYQKHTESQNKKKARQGPVALKNSNSVAACLFCNFKSESIQKNLDHMQMKHGFFIPEPQNLIYLEGLMKYLQNKVHLNLTCLHCNNEGAHNFKSGQAVQQHMIDKQHCFLNIDYDESEYAHFYNWEEDEFEILSDEEQYVDLGEASSNSSVVSTIVPRMIKIPGEVTPTGELLLDSGKLLGVKEYSRYYRQNYRNVNLEGAPKKNTQLENRQDSVRFSNQQQLMLKQGLKNNSLRRNIT